MYKRFLNKRINSILTIVPKNEVKYIDEIKDYPFPESQSIKLGKVMGYDTRRICMPEDTISDYATFGLRYLIENKKLLSREDIDAIVVVSSSQDYIIPYVSYIIQGNLNLSQDVYCLDINQACGGYIFGLMETFLLLDNYNFKKVVLVTGDFLSKKMGKKDRNSRPIIGDAVNISIIENSNFPNEIHVNYKNYGVLNNIIKIPAGGFRKPSDINTSKDEIDSFGNYRSLDNFHMDGEEVFNFVMSEVPILINELLEKSDKSHSNIDYYLFHQPNKYMVNKLSDELDIPYSKTFNNIVEIYGNSSTATIPLNICHNISDSITTKNLTLLMSGFGAGLTCNSMYYESCPFELCEIIEY